MIAWLRGHRISVTISAIVLVVLAGGVYVGVSVLDTGPQQATAEPLKGNLLFVELADGRNRVEQIGLEDPGKRTVTPMSCQRVFTAAGTTACLKLSGPSTYSAEVTDQTGKIVKSVGLPGIPSRAKVSASGRIVTWTSFVSGDSYSVPGGFSTRTGYLDVSNGDVVDSVEHFDAEVNGQPFTSNDINYWGLTVGSDDRTFYATMASGENTWLVRGDFVTKKVTSLRKDAECPSLSPDGTKVAYKKRIGAFGPWELAVYDLATRVEKRLPGTGGIDDQATWLGNDKLAYAALLRDQKLPSISVVPVDGSAPAQMIIPDATSPAPVN